MTEDSGQLAQHIVTNMAQGDFASIEQRLSDTLKALLPADRLKMLWQGLEQQVGVFQTQVEVRTINLAQGAFQVVTCAFEHAQLDVNLLFNAADEIVSLTITPVGALEQQAHATYSPPPYAHPEQFSEREVQVGQGEWSLPGTLTLPVGAGPFRAVVLVHGSGAHDRDETISPNKPFRDLAWGLATQGIAVLRYDKRTRVYGPKMELTTVTVQEETIDDALQAVELLRAQPEIDEQQLFVLGHSLGGYLAPRIAVAAPILKGLVMLAASARPLEDVILDQMRYVLPLSLPPTASQQQIEEIEKQVALVKSSQLTAATPSSALPLGVPAAYWLDLRGYRPELLACTLPQSMLILHADSDYQVTEDDFQLWRQALSTRDDVTLKHYPGLYHLFMATEAGKKATPASYSIAGHVALEVVEDIARWIISQ